MNSATVGRVRQDAPRPATIGAQLKMNLRATPRFLRPVAGPPLRTPRDAMQDHRSLSLVPCFLVAFNTNFRLGSQVDKF